MNAKKGTHKEIHKSHINYIEKNHPSFLYLDICLKKMPQVIKSDYQSFKTQPAYLNTKRCHFQGLYWKKSRTLY